MEQNNQIKFRVICNNEKYLNSTLQWYNSIYKTDFKVSEFILDEVNFAVIEATRYSISDIFNIGYAFGAKEEKLRISGEIDW